MKTKLLKIAQNEIEKYFDFMLPKFHEKIAQEILQMKDSLDYDDFLDFKEIKDAIDFDFSQLSSEEIALVRFHAINEIALSYEKKVAKEKRSQKNNKKNYKKHMTKDIHTPIALLTYRLRAHPEDQEIDLKLARLKLERGEPLSPKEHMAYSLFLIENGI